MAVLATPFYLQFFDPTTNLPVRNGKIYTYAAGTTTPKATYTGPDEAHQAPNPVELDSAGRCTMWIKGAYRFKLVDENGVTIDDADNVVSFSTPGQESDPYYELFDGDGITQLFNLSKPMGNDPLNIDLWVDMDDGKGYNILNPTQYTLDGSELFINIAPAANPPKNVYVKASDSFLGQAALYASQAESSANDAAQSAEDAENAAIDAESAAEDAEDAAELAENYALALTGTSDTNLTLGNGHKTFTTQEQKQWVLGQRLRASSNDALFIMEGPVVSYIGDQLTLNVNYTVGIGDNNQWNIAITGSRGEQGPSGSVTDGDKGDILVSDEGQQWTIKPGSVSPSKLDRDYMPLNPRVDSLASGNVAPSADYDIIVRTAQSASLLFTTPSSVPAPWQALMVYIKDNGVARSISYSSDYVPVGVELPIMTVAGKEMYFGLIWNPVSEKYDVIMVGQED